MKIKVNEYHLFKKKSWFEWHFNWISDPTEEINRLAKKKPNKTFAYNITIHLIN